MKVEITDNDVFSSFIPSELENYLLATRWREIRREDKLVSIWEYDEISDAKYRVWLPLDPTLADYSTAVGRIIKTVALAENRSQLQVVQDLGEIATGDVIRTVMWDELNRSSNSIPISEGSLLFHRSYSMTYAAACAAVDKRPVFPYRSPAKVTKYMQGLRLGQSEPGSYVMKLISPIQPMEPQPSQQTLPGVSESEEIVPFERQVTISLVKSLNVLQSIASETQRRGRFYFEPFEEAVQEGISANLCEAIVGDRKEEKRHYPVKVSVSWSYLIDPPDSSTETEMISFPKSVMPYIAQAAVVFRERNPEDISLKGYVTALSRPQMDEPGTIRVIGRVDGEKRSIRMTLVGDAYNIAIHAHENDLLIGCKGELAKQGNFFFLRNPFDFHVIEEKLDQNSEQMSLFGE